MSESVVQKSAVQTFKNLGYKSMGSHVKINGVSPKIDDTFRREIQKLNRTRLGGQELTDDEFQRLKNEYPRDTEDAYHKLRDGIMLYRDNGDRVLLDLIDKANPQNNSFQIAEEVIVQGVTTSRLDLLVLINGVPVSHIELKRPGLPQGMEEALAQINRYNNASVYNQGMLRFVQVFGISNGVQTKYFSVDPRAAFGRRYQENIFSWMDKYNKPVGNLDSFIKHFYEKDMFVNTLFNYMLLTETEQKTKNSLVREPAEMMILRPHQVHAVDAALSSVERGLDSHIAHSTGSGKTLTSFKTAQVMSQQLDKKVIMLVDRNDLADQTIAKFLEYDKTGTVDDIKKGRDLDKALQDKNQRLVVSTIHSFSRWIARASNAKTVKKLADSRNVVFIFDECHRSTSGEMMKNIKQGFYDPERGAEALKCIMLGFTGTPLLEENTAHGGRTTQSIFGEASHIYTITEAIRDKNVLPFKTFNVEVSSTLSEDVPMDRSYYTSRARLKANAEEIAASLKNHTHQMDKVKNNTTEGCVAMLAAPGKSAAQYYWSVLTPLLAQQNRTTGIVFSVDQHREAADDDRTIYERDWYTEFFVQHDQNFGTTFSQRHISEFDYTMEQYNTDVIARTQTGEIDLVIVSDMLLTGYDNKRLNTIYIDKSLEYHTLLQACSRTNRLAGDQKVTGNIVLFSDRDMEADLETAMKLFGDTDNLEEILDTSTYEETERRLRYAISELKYLANQPVDVMQVTRVQELKAIIRAYQQVVSVVKEIKTYPQWHEDTSYAEVGMRKSDIEYYYAYIQQMKEHLNPKDLDDPHEENPLDGIEFDLKTVDGVKYDYNYLMTILNDFIPSPPDELERWLRKARKVLDEVIRNGGEVDSREVFEELFKACQRGEIQTVDELYERLGQERYRKYNQEIQDAAQQFSIDEQELRRFIDTRARSRTGTSPSRIQIKKQLTQNNDPRSQKEQREVAAEIFDALDSFVEQKQE